MRRERTATPTTGLGAELSWVRIWREGNVYKSHSHRVFGPCYRITNTFINQDTNYWCINNAETFYREQV